MKQILILSTILFLGLSTTAQNGQSALSKGENQLNVGLGFNTSGFPVYVGMDFAVHNNVTVGPMLKIRMNDDDKTSVILVGRADFHWNRLMGIPGNWDFYTGANLGGRFRDGIYLDLGLQIGGRWYFNDKLGLNLEFGGGRSFGSLLGLSIRL